MRTLLRRGSIASLLIGLVIAVGSNRVPADPTAPLTVTGDVAQAVDPDGPLRIATFNIHSGKGNDARVDLARTAETLREVDFAALQEVRGGWRPTDSQAAKLGALLGLRAVFVAGERRWWHDGFGNGLLSRLPIEAIHRVPLPNTRGKAYRVATIAEMSHRGTTVRVLAAHIARGADREVQLRAVCRLFLSLEQPAVLLGDLNTSADDSELAALIAHAETTAVVGVGVDARGAAGSPAATGIDWIIARGPRCVGRKVVDNGASDHPAIVAELELAPPAAHRLARSPLGETP
ncbi:MAG: endonuclease/exonuclease/phosphatase family protein [Planctomycetaceae bacterium]